MNLMFLEIALLITNYSFQASQQCPGLRFDIICNGVIIEKESEKFESSVSYEQTVRFEYLDDYGNCNIEVYENGILAVKGKYVADSTIYEMLIRYENLDDDGSEPVIESYCYYKPLRHSIWNYYSKDGLVVRSEDYEKGSLYAVSSFSDFSSKK